MELVGVRHPLALPIAGGYSLIYSVKRYTTFRTRRFVWVVYGSQDNLAQGDPRIVVRKWHGFTLTAGCCAQEEGAVC